MQTSQPGAAAGGPANGRDSLEVMPLELDFRVFQDFAIAVLIGLFIGIERERHHRGDDRRTIGGLRTFTLFALVGAMGGWLTRELDTPWVLASVLASTAAIIISGYVQTSSADPETSGLTTEAAALATVLLGALTMVGYREIAIALGVVVAAVLAYKEPLHGIVDKLGRDDVYAGIRLLIATFIVLPLLPNHPLDPWSALNPASLWKLVLLISGLSLVGYVGTRLLGTARGLLVTAATGGLVSSTAVTLTFARQSADPAYRHAEPALAAAVVLAWCIMFVRVLVEVLVVNRELVGPLLPSLLAMIATGAAGGWMLQRRAGSAAPAQIDEMELRNPFSLTAAAKFAGFFAVVLLIVKLVETYAPGKGMYFVAALAGTTDVDAITLSMANYGRSGDPHIAVNSIVIAALVNTAVKAGMVAVLGTADLRNRVLVVTAAILAAGSIALLF